MARHLLTDATVRPLVQQLVILVLREGSVNAAQKRLVGTLAADKTEGWVYPNRVHSLVSGEPSRAINSDTLDAVRRALARLPDGLLDPAAARIESGELRARAGAEWEANADAPPPDRLGRVADQLNLPPAVITWLLDEAGVGEALAEPALRPPGTRQDQTPDWSFQDVAHSRTVSALERDVNTKVGLIIPTGGGKTRVAMRVLLSILAHSEREDSVVLWVTHRLRLRTQAHRELQRAVTAGTADLPEDSVGLLSKRVEFCMISELESRISELGDRVELVVVDEAHHAAATSYRPIFEHKPLRGLFLTATPNRTDLRPIGIEEIAYSITSRELFDHGVIVEPRLDVLTLDGFDWDEPQDLEDLADYVLERAQDDFVKTLVAVSRVDHAVALHEALDSVLDGYEEHVLDHEDIAYVHGDGSSTGQHPDTLLDEFGARPRGILVATTQLLGEGFDDPAINTVVVTYPTQSMVQLMQAAGRCLRSAPGKTEAFVVQVKDSALAYHWEQGWLYQDIADALRPQLEHREYSSFEDLAEQLEEILDKSHIRDVTAAALRAEFAGVEAGDNVSLLLTGLPHYGPEDAFAAAGWSGVLSTPGTRERFLRVFNDFSALSATVNQNRDFLSNYLSVDPTPGSLWNRYMDMLHAMSYASRELAGEDYAGAGGRPYTPAGGTTWLRYITFTYNPAIPEALDTFLEDAANRDDVIARYLAEPDRWALAVKLPLPLAGTIAYLLDGDQAEWLGSQRQALRESLKELPPTQSFGAVAAWRQNLGVVPVPLQLVIYMERLLRSEEFDLQSLPLTAISHPDRDAGSDGLSP